MEEISVIVPVYNVEKFLKKSIVSITNQTYKNLEIILVDDGSPDRCGEICDEFAKKDKRIIVIHKNNGGQSSARNTGLDKVTGKYVTFVDSDDIIEPYTFEILYKSLIEHNSDIAICGHRTVNEGETIYKETKQYSSEKLSIEDVWDEVFGNLNNAVWNKLYKSELLRDIRFKQGLIHGEDLIFNLEYLHKCKSGAFNRTVCYNYLKRDNSITSAAFSEKKLMEITSKDRALELVTKYMPSQIINAEKYCFRARMNVIRSIYMAGLEKEYETQIDECIGYIKNNYYKIKHRLKIKDKLEYILFFKSQKIYIEYLKLIRK